ncbi:MAG: SAF domain-containing protein [Propioniciclava sp.]|uniref:SAF domain-containing protein n=1 Tax=Propioniciclava sp. TaxID=2038686 RepID=UPI0039E6B14A
MTTVTDAARPRLRVRRSPLWLAAGLIAIALGGLGSAAVFSSLSASQPVLQATRTLHRGEIIQSSDLTTVPVSAGLGVATVPESRLSDVVGRAAVTDVPGGSLLVDGSWGDAGLPSGQSRVGVRLASGRFPVSDLRPGTPLLVVALPSGSSESGTDADVLPGSVRATLVAAPVQQADASATFDLNLASEDAEAVARLAAADRVALVQIEGRR